MALNATGRTVPGVALSQASAAHERCTWDKCAGNIPEKIDNPGWSETFCWMG
ncbi:MAG: hypothetical protein GX263_07050 [Firmicutes bacterium]|nr:hypothetical protein [Bacillota bacterium]